MAERVCVMVRFRPDSQYQQQQVGFSASKDKESPVQMISSDKTEVVMSSVAGYGQSKTFTFDRIFAPDSAQEEVFKEVGRPLVDAAMEGYNGTVLAYGQTGSGKTHTMMGPEGGKAEGFVSEQRGLVPRIMDELFTRLGALSKGSEIEWSVTAAMFEMYNEVLYDLAAVGSLSSGSTSAASSLAIREDRATGRGVYVEGLVTKPMETTHQFVEFMQSCSRNKHVARTNSNETSSRSHTIVQVSVMQQNNVYGGTRTTSNIFLVDLAGSERIEKTGAEGQRLKEAQSINLSLTLLGNVINKLTDSSTLHVPYRDSKLTRLLQDSLGGNSRTTLLCMGSPMAANHTETMSTLAFATRAKSIQNKPRANKELSGDELKKAFTAAMEEIRLLTEKVQLLEGSPITGTLRRKDSTPRPDTSEDLASLLREIEQLKMESLENAKKIGSMQDRIDYHRRREEELTAKNVDFKAKYEREKMAADSWMRKFEELEKTHAAVPPSSKPTAKKSGVVVKGKGERGASVSKKDVTGTPRDEGLVDQVPPHEEGPRLEDLEVRWAVKEKGYLQQIEDLEAKRTEFAKASILVERLSSERDTERKKFNEDMDNTIAKYEALLSAQDKEIGALQLKLDERVVQTQARQFGMMNDMERLQKENDTVHEENKAHATRLLDFAKRIEKQVKEIETLHSERVRLMKEIEVCNLSAEEKSRILGGKIRAEQKSLFQRKLLDCFARAENEM